VTQGQWKKVMGTEPWKGRLHVQEGDDYPAVYVSWNDAVEFCKKLSSMEGAVYRLPTEAEWEYACRGGTKTAFSFGNDEAELSKYAWWGGFSGNGNVGDEQYAHRVAQKLPNPYGLYDMHGNVYEWCSDWYGDYPSTPLTDPRGPSSGSFHVLRGGSCYSGPGFARCASRYSVTPGRRYYSGFRLVLELTNAATASAAVAPADAPMKPAPSGTPVKPAAAVPVTNSIGIVLQPIPAGTFMMGSPASGKGRFVDETQHQVTLTKPFSMGRTEVTQGQWKKVMGTEPWKGEDYVQEGDDYPAVYVSWNDAVEFCEKLSAMEGKVYRLPTEAEWEYACRGGTKTAFSFGDDEAELGKYAWFDGNAWDIDEKYAHRVAQKLPNPFGLYDMHGNVWEWCSDWKDDYPSTPLTDPRGPDAGSFRVLRGGSWNSEPYNVRCAFRNYNTPENRYANDGFRLVLE
jgi:formylglycine-generating enzyme required for sulfatase activity